MKSVTSRDVARAAGVSQTTVSRVMTNSGLISPETCRKVLAAARALNYDMTPAGDHWTVGVITTLNPTYYRANLLHRMATEILNRGLRLELFATEIPESWEIKPVRGIIDLRICPTKSLPDPFCPMVRINESQDPARMIGSVSFDDEQNMMSAVQYLTGIGHHNICFLSFEGRKEEENKICRRWPGFQKAVKKYKLNESRSRGIFVDFNADIRKNAAILRKAVEDGCTALICVNADHLVKLLVTLKKAKIRVPEDISLLVWENEMITQELELTGLDDNFSRLCSAALDMLDSMLKKRSVPPPIKVPGTWIFRSSVRRINEK